MSGGEILSTLLASEVRGDLLILFHKNPGLIDTVDGIARRIGRTTISVISDVRELVQLGLLKQKRIGASEVLFLDRAKDREILESVANNLKTAQIGGAKGPHHHPPPQHGRGAQVPRNLHISKSRLGVRRRKLAG